MDMLVLIFTYHIDFFLKTGNALGLLISKMFYYSDNYRFRLF